MRSDDPSDLKRRRAGDSHSRVLDATDGGLPRTSSGVSRVATRSPFMSCSECGSRWPTTAGQFTFFSFRCRPKTVCPFPGGLLGRWNEDIGEHVEAFAFELSGCVFLLPRVGLVKEQAGGVVVVVLAEFFDNAAEV